MDYETKPTSRHDLRLFSALFRSIIGVSKDEAIDPVSLLDLLTDLENFNDFRYEVVYNNQLPGNVPAQCIIDSNGYLVQIKESVYIRAYEKKSGGDRMHIMHEIMHVYADKLGFKPILSRTLNKKIYPFKSIEWIVMALAGEVMMPYEATKNMSKEEIMKTYDVSESAAETRLKY